MVASAIESIKSALIGMIPLDASDEGLVSIGETVSLEAIYDFFKQAINEYEAGVAQAIFLALKG